MHLEAGIPSISLKSVIILQNHVVIYMKHSVFLAAIYLCWIFIEESNNFISF